MRDGKVVDARPAGDFTRNSLVGAMGSVAEEEAVARVFASKRRQRQRRGSARGRRARARRSVLTAIAARSSASPASAAMARPTCWSAW